jgi:uncharacterized membrane protein YfhO
VYGNHHASFFLACQNNFKYVECNIDDASYMEENEPKNTTNKISQPTSKPTNELSQPMTETTTDPINYNFCGIGQYEVIPDGTWTEPISSIYFIDHRKNDTAIQDEIERYGLV